LSQQIPLDPLNLRDLVILLVLQLPADLTRQLILFA
jgi:hypothetical protein